MESAKSRILNAATRLFANRGYAAVSTKMIARSAKVSETSIFRLFRSKAKLLAAAAEYANSQFPEVMPNPGLKPEDSVPLVASQLTEAWRSHSDAVNLYFQAALTQASSPEGRALRAVAKARLDKVYGTFVPGHQVAAARRGVCLGPAPAGSHHVSDGHAFALPPDL